MATGNVLLPPLVKLHFPARIGLVTGIYSTALLMGAALPSVTVLPVVEEFDSWRAGLAMWAITAAVALVPWLGLVAHDVHTDREPTTIPMSRLAHTRLAWAMAVFFGVQSATAYAQFGWLPEIYADAGLGREQAALMLGVLTGVSIPVALLLPALTQRRADQRPVVVAFGVLTTTGFLGLLISPTTLPGLWAVLMGLGSSAFPWVLTMLGLRARTHDGTVALSGFVQSIGYLLAVFGPLGTGVLYDLTDSWSLPLLVLAISSAVLVPAGLYVARERWIEDELTGSAH
jgi:CP family cyanate transporter-like MFS transporter